MNLRQRNHLMRHARKDELYQDFVRTRDILEPEYRRILSSLSPDDQMLVKYYVNSCLGAEERVARTAYFMTPTR